MESSNKNILKIKSIRKNISLLIIFFSLLLSGCEEKAIKYTYIYDKPQLALEHEESNIYYKEYPVYFKLKLEKGNGVDKKYEISYKISGAGKILNADDTKPSKTISQDEVLALQYIPKTLGNHKVEFALIDSQGQESNAILEVKGVREKVVNYPDFEFKLNSIFTTGNVGSPYYREAFYADRSIWQSIFTKEINNLTYDFLFEESFISENAVKYNVQVSISDLEFSQGKIVAYYDDKRYILPSNIPLKKDRATRIQLKYEKTNDCAVVDKPIIAKFKFSNGQTEKDTSRSIKVLQKDNSNYFSIFRSSGKESDRVYSYKIGINPGRCIPSDTSYYTIKFMFPEGITGFIEANGQTIQENEIYTIKAKGTGQAYQNFLIKLHVNPGSDYENAKIFISNSLGLTLYDECRLYQ